VRQNIVDGFSKKFGTLCGLRRFLVQRRERIMVIFISGVLGAALLVVGSNLVVPVGIEVGSFIELVGVGSMMVCFGLADGE
jgi:hypothetical protein